MRAASRPPTHARLLPRGLRVLHLTADPERLMLHVEPETNSARCPLCGFRSERVHSRYARTVSDLPWRGIAVKVEVRARRFFCDPEGCGRRVLCERLPEIAARSRKTGRLEEALLVTALELGGEAGARLARELGLVVSPDVLLDRICRGVGTAEETSP